MMWSDTDNAELMRLWSTGVSAKDIASIFKVSLTAVTKQVNRLQTARKPPAMVSFDHMEYDLVG